MRSLSMPDENEIKYQEKVQEKRRQLQRGTDRRGLYEYEALFGFSLQDYLDNASIIPFRWGDMPSGQGEALREGKRVFGDKIYVTAIDIRETDQTLIDRFLQYDISYERPPENSFDLVTSVRGLWFLRDPIRGLINMYATIRQGGDILVELPKKEKQTIIIESKKATHILDWEEFLNEFYHTLQIVPNRIGETEKSYLHKVQKPAHLHLDLYKNNFSQNSFEREELGSVRRATYSLLK